MEAIEGDPCIDQRLLYNNRIKCALGKRFDALSNEEVHGYANGSHTLLAPFRYFIWIGRSKTGNRSSEFSQFLGQCHRKVNNSFIAFCSLKMR